jgi:Dolichyl-phosphate-mannose-protein mannosyltransferase
MRRAIQTLEGLGFQESGALFDHPYFGQIFLAGVFKIIGYPDSLNPKPGDVQTVEMLYLVPRVLMGLLAVLDTFLVYKIADRLYDRKIAFVSSLFFAVMPMTWMLRRIYLDSILLPLLLSSIFFALYYAKRPTRIANSRNTDFADDNYKHIPIVLLSGIFLGLAIFTKIPVFTMIPLVAYLIYKYAIYGDKKRLKILGIWFIPVILIPAIWPVYSALNGESDDWLNSVLWQTSRLPRPMVNMVNYLLEMDPVLLILGIAGIAFAAIRRDVSILLWSIPLFVFLTAINYVGLFHLIPLMPVFCIAAAILIVQMVQLAKRVVSKGKKKEEIQLSITNYIDNGNNSDESEIRGGGDQVQEKNELKHYPSRVRKIFGIGGLKFAYLSSILLIVIVGCIGMYGLAVTTSFILENVTASYFSLYSNIIKELHDYDGDNTAINKMAIIGPDWLRDFYWIPKYVFNKDIDFQLIGKTPSDTKFILLADRIVTDTLALPEHKNYLPLHQLFNTSKPIAIYNDQLVKLLPYPELSLKDKREIVGDYGGRIEIRANY